MVGRPIETLQQKQQATATTAACQPHQTTMASQASQSAGIQQGSGLREIINRFKV